MEKRIDRKKLIIIIYFFFDPAEGFDGYFDLAYDLDGIVFIVGQSQNKEKISFQSKETVCRV